ncbi:E3 ubiquitin-protein ligase PUB24 [Morella rubra]|uniref:U-box domain-containing protein n=1 Tax=Morella rubra TaxID=262757 RepID=A0A6A1UKY8_9ROSI|nr:E3 ubiquitin-protein ligase PUB24 [Morella rubra]
MDDIEVPQYFICPISLQIMKDPVTAITGITYDRESIEHWLFTSKNTICPVSKQPLPKASDLTPNHTLRRLIQAWCTQNASHGIDRIPTPKPPLDKFQVLKLIKHLWQPRHQLKTIRQLELLAAENERNRTYMVEAGVPRAMLLFIAKCFERGQMDLGLEEALSVLQLIPIPSSETTQLLIENDHLINSLKWVLCCELENHDTVKSHAMVVLKAITNSAGSRVLERLEPGFFKTIVRVLRSGITQHGLNAALQVLLDTCPWGRNRIMMVEAGAVFELIEFELGLPEKRTTELIFGILFHLCSLADGRAQFLNHRGSIAVVAKRILKVSQAVNDRAVLILSMICKFSGTYMVLQEMLKVGAVSKLCQLLQVDCDPLLKDKAREILRAHSQEWKDSPCIRVSQDQYLR